jgi:predicted oxidoreductase
MVYLFPSAALRIDGLRLGPTNDPLIAGGHVDIVLQLFPLWKERIVINRLLISDSRVNILKQGSAGHMMFLKNQRLKLQVTGMLWSPIKFGKHYSNLQ